MRRGLGTEEYSEEDIREIIKRAMHSYPFWMAHQYPKAYELSKRHGIVTLVLTLSDGRVFDIKVKERRR